MAQDPCSAGLIGHLVRAVLLTMILMAGSSCKAQNTYRLLDDPIAEEACALNQVVIYRLTQSDLRYVGHGFMVGPDGTIVTCRHILRLFGWGSLNRPYIRFVQPRSQGLRYLESTVVDTSDEYDVGVLRIIERDPDDVPRGGLLLRDRADSVYNQGPFEMYTRLPDTLSSPYDLDSYGLTHMKYRSTTSSGAVRMTISGTGIFRGNSGAAVVQYRTPCVTGMLIGGKPCKFDSTRFCEAYVLPAPLIVEYLNSLGISANTVSLAALPWATIYEAPDTFSVTAVTHPPVNFFAIIRDGSGDPIEGVSSEVIAERDKIPQVLAAGRSGEYGILRLTDIKLESECEKVTLHLSKSYCKPVSVERLICAGGNLESFSMEQTTWGKFRGYSSVFAFSAWIGILIAFYLDGQVQDAKHEYASISDDYPEEQAQQLSAIHYYRVGREFGISIAIAGGLLWLVTYLF